MRRVGGPHLSGPEQVWTVLDTAVGAELAIPACRAYLMRQQSKEGPPMPPAQPQRVRLPIASFGRKRAGGAYRRDDVVDCLAGCGRVGFVVEKRLVSGVVGNAVHAVGGQCDHMVLRRLLFR